MEERRRRFGAIGYAIFDDHDNCNCSCSGYGIGTVNAQTDGLLFDKLHITQLPAIVVVVEGRVVHYRENFQARSIRLFARNAIPNTVLLRIANYDGLRRFVDQCVSTNKVSFIVPSRCARVKHREHECI
jgi:hypothetical protein